MNKNPSKICPKCETKIHCKLSTCEICGHIFRRIKTMKRNINIFDEIIGDDKIRISYLTRLQTIATDIKQNLFSISDEKIEDEKKPKV